MLEGLEEVEIYFLRDIVGKLLLNIVISFMWGVKKKLNENW